MTFEEVKIARDDPEFECDDLEFQRMIDIAIEKQIPKKGGIKYVNSYTDDPPVMICPCCQNSHPCEASNLYKYCFYCGQALDWSE